MDREVLDPSIVEFQMLTIVKSSLEEGTCVFFGLCLEKALKNYKILFIILRCMNCLPILSHVTNFENDLYSSWSPWYPWYNNDSKAFETQGIRLLDSF